MTTTIDVLPEEATLSVRTAPRVVTKPKRQPAYHVILLDDDDHTYEYVIGMFQKLFGHTKEAAYQLATEVDGTGRVIADTTSMERAELKRDQILSFGRDWRISRCAGSMTAVMEPAPE